MDELRAAVAWTGDAVEIIDQTKLPAEEVVLRLETPEDVVDLESLEPGARAAASRGVIATVERLLLERDSLGSAEAVAVVAGEEIARAA